ncbi:MAG: M3 family oligoendopeptidase [Herpetosiphonaceae bacterium]|nr:M3 family oligoendopeptidase [Herpetosiphonaceae bacterium]
MSMKTIDPLSWATIQPVVDALLAADLTGEQLAGWLRQWSDLEAQLNEFSFRAYRAMTEDTTDAEAEKRFLYVVEELDPKSRVASQSLKEKLLAADTSQLPPTASQMLQRFRAEAELFREVNIPLFTELDRLGNEFNKIMGAMTVELEGETQTMQQIQKLWSSPDRDVRSRAWRASLDRFLQDRTALNALFLKMLPLRRQIARNAGKDSFVEYVWQQYGRFDYSPADCRTFHAAIEQEVVPLVRKWRARHQEQLGIASLRPWDLDVDPQSRPALAPFSDAAELEAGGQRMFDQVDPVLGERYTQMRDGYLDLGSRQGKAPGGYCGGMFVAKVPYIFMNAVGTHDDVQTLLHEGGHAFHFMESAAHNDLIWNYDGPMEFCEVASMAMELLAAPYLDQASGGFYSSADARRARAEHLLKTLTFLPYMAVVDAFQHWVYSEASDDVSAADLDAKWGELWDRFMVGEDWSGLGAEKLTGWHRKMHIFTTPLYYIEYGLAELGALQVWRNALQDQAGAVAQYRSALALGNTRSLSQLFAAAGATFGFDRATVGELARLVDAHLEQLEA